MTKLTQPVTRQVVFDGMLSTTVVKIIRAVPITASHTQDLPEAVMVEDT